MFRVNDNPEKTFLKRLQGGRRKAILFHYTSAAGLLGILKDRGIWATDIRYLNDSREYFYALEVLREAIEIRKGSAKPKYLIALLEMLEDRLSQEHSTEIFISSFTENPDQLSQWRAYCAPHGGFAVGFSSKRLVPATTGACWMVRCQYDEGEQRELAETLIDLVIDPVEAELRSDNREQIFKDAYRRFTRLLHLLAPAMKDPSFAEEQEWRLVIPGDSIQVSPRFRISRSMLIPYHLHPLASQDEPLPIEKVIVGPTPHERLAVRATEILFSENRLNAANVVASAIPFRSW